MAIAGRLNAATTLAAGETVGQREGHGMAALPGCGKTPHPAMACVASEPRGQPRALVDGPPGIELGGIEGAADHLHVDARRA